jgi:hypothetical protein
LSDGAENYNYSTVFNLNLTASSKNLLLCQASWTPLPGGLELHYENIFFYDFMAA